MMGDTLGSHKTDNPDATRTFRTPASSADTRGYALLVSAASGTRVVPLGEGPTFRIGRAPTCDVSLPDDSLSREHAELSIEGDVTIRDLGSKNGTRVAGETLAPRVPTPVTVGTPIELGAVMLVLQRAIVPTAAEEAPETHETLRVSSRKSMRPRGEPIIADAGMRHLYALLDVVAPSPLSVLILGETGTGKEVYAEAIHARSSRASGPFVPLHCAALPESLLEAELFGYEKGAFTGATNRKPGIFESANGGTVFLDEIGEVPLATQARLLRVLESGEVMRLGSVRPLNVDVRFVSATHRDLRALIAHQQFRADLYFRLNGMSIHLPPLRSRKADVRALAEMFVARSAAGMKRGALTIDDAVYARLESYEWPGNVRELKNVLDRTVLLCKGDRIEIAHLLEADADAFGAKATRAASMGDEGALKSQLRDLERQKIVDALAKNGGNQSHAAKDLGISRFTLMNKMEAFGVVRPRKGR